LVALLPALGQRPGRRVDLGGGLPAGRISFAFGLHGAGLSAPTLTKWLVAVERAVRFCQGRAEFMGEIFLAGRVLLGGYYLFSAIHHFTDTATLARYAGSAGVPLPTLAVIVAGLLLAIAGVSLILGIYPDVGIAALAL